MSATVRAPRQVYSPSNPERRSLAELIDSATDWTWRELVRVVFWTAVFLAGFGVLCVGVAAQAHGDDRTPPPSSVRVSALPVRSATPTVTPTPELLPATSTTLGVDAATVVPKSYRPARLANTGGPDAWKIGIFGLVFVAGGVFVLWLAKWGER